MQKSSSSQQVCQMKIAHRMIWTDIESYLVVKQNLNIYECAVNKFLVTSKSPNEAVTI